MMSFYGVWRMGYYKIDMNYKIPVVHARVFDFKRGNEWRHWAVNELHASYVEGSVPPNRDNLVKILKKFMVFDFNLITSSCD
jgi:hypothetical protein